MSHMLKCSSVALAQLRVWAPRCSQMPPNYPHNTLQVRAQALPSSESFDFCSFLADPATVRDWNIQGLPADAFRWGHARTAYTQCTQNVHKVYTQHTHMISDAGTHFDC